MKAAKKPRTEAGQARAVLADIIEQHPETFPTWRRHRQLTITMKEAEGTAHEETVRALIRIIDGPRRDRFEEAIQRCLDAYIKPVGIAIHDQMGRPHTPTLDGNEARWRREYLTARGWRFERDRMHPPEDWLAIRKANKAKVKVPWSDEPMAIPDMLDVSAAIRRLAGEGQ